MVKKDIFRIIDANFNRSREGLRVCEDISRFMLNSTAMTSQLKKVRHDITAIRKRLPGGSGMLCEARDSEQDVGRCSRAPREMKRSSAADVFGANIERAKESVRVLEEFFKLIDKKDAVRFSAIRYRIYEIEKRASGRLLSLRHTR